MSIHLLCVQDFFQKFGEVADTLASWLKTMAEMLEKANTMIGDEETIKKLNDLVRNMCMRYTNGGEEKGKSPSFSQDDEFFNNPSIQEQIEKMMAEAVEKFKKKTTSPKASQDLQHHATSPRAPHKAPHVKRHKKVDPSMPSFKLLSQDTLTISPTQPTPQAQSECQTPEGPPFSPELDAEVEKTIKEVIGELKTGENILEISDTEVEDWKKPER